VIQTETKAWAIPYCGRCLTHAKIAAVAEVIAGIVGVVAILVGVALWNGVSHALGVVVGLALLAGAAGIYLAIMRAAMAFGSPACACAGKAAKYLGWSGTLHRFEFVSLAFAAAFMAANQSKLVNVSHEARQLLQSEGLSQPQGAPQTPERFLS
jgi:hypothetical protein